MTDKTREQILDQIEMTVLDALLSVEEDDSFAKVAKRVAKSLEDAGLLVTPADLTERHIIKYHEGGFTILHPAAERANGGQGLFDCEVFAVAKATIFMSYQDGTHYCGLDEAGEFHVYERVS